MHETHKNIHWINNLNYKISIEKEGGMVWRTENQTKNIQIK